MSEPFCKGCHRAAAAHVPEREVRRLVNEYLAVHPDARLVETAVYENRLTICGECPDAQFGGTTCRHCGCLVAVRARLADKACPAVRPRWNAWTSAPSAEGETS